MTDSDSPWKDAIEVYFQAFVAFCFPLIYNDIDWSRGYEFLDKELQQIAPEAARGRRYVDKLVKVWTKSGTEEWLLIHIEVQTQRDADFPARMYVYSHRIPDKYNHQVVSLAVLADDSPTWRPDRYEWKYWGCEKRLVFPTVKLLDYANRVTELLADENPFAMVVLAHLKMLETRRDPGARYDWKLRLARGLYERGWDAERVRKLLKFIDWLMWLPEPLEDRYIQEVDSIQEKKTMPFLSSPEAFAMKKGLMAGIATVLDIKFGEEGVRFLPEIPKYFRWDKLERLLGLIKTAQTLDEVRQMCATLAAEPERDPYDSEDEQTAP